VTQWLYFSPQSVIGTTRFEVVRCGGQDIPMRECTLAEAGRTLQGKAVQVILPMEACSWIRSPCWPSRKRPRPMALGYAVEEHLGEDVDALHVAVGKPDVERRYPLLIIAKALLRELLGALQTAEIHVESVRVDADMLAADRPCGVGSEGRWLIGGGLEARIALSEQAMSTLRPHLPADISWQSVDESRLPPLLMQGKGSGIELLQGEFRISHRPWRLRPVLLALACLLLMLWGCGLARIHHLEARASQLYAQSLQHFQMLYPGHARIVDLPMQFKALKAQRGDEQGPMSALLALAEQVSGDGIEVSRAEFQITEGWKLMIVATGFHELERLRDRAEKRGLAIRLDSVSKEREGVRAVLTLHGSTR